MTHTFVDNDLDQPYAPLNQPPVWGRRFESESLFVEICPRQPYEVRYCSDWHILGFTLEAQRGEHSFGSDRIQSYRAPANTFSFTPAGCDTFSTSETGGTYLIFALEPKRFTDYAQDLLGERPLSLRRLEHLRNPQVNAIARATRQFAQAQATMKVSGGRLYFEALAGQFASHVVLTLGEQSNQLPQAAELNQQMLSQLREYVDANLAEDLSLAQLAMMVSMSVSRFRRAFKAKTGRSPYIWVMERRLGRAQQLLKQESDAIATIALDCGFSSQSHMTTVFSKRLGTTPR